MKKVFLDIGSHLGETLDVVRGPQYGFDRIFAFEPSPKCCSELKKYSDLDSRIQILPYGLGKVDDTAILYDSGSLSATTLFSGQISGGDATLKNSDKVHIRRASDWIRSNLGPDDLIVAKLNCEGGEVDIIDDLLDNGLISYFYSLMITFDIRCFPDRRHLEGKLRARLRATGLKNFCFSDDVVIGPTHYRRISNWLELFGLDRDDLSSVERYRVEYAEVLEKYSNKRGYLPRAEAYLKHLCAYEAFPPLAKNILRSAKALLRLNKEREVYFRQ